MKLKKIIKDYPIIVKGSKEIEITGICANSKLVAPGNIFVAKKGRVADGASYIPEAIQAGAIAILTDIYDPTLKVTQLIHLDVNAAEAFLAATYYQFASHELFMIGITGTNGKTTTSFILKHLLDHQTGSCGLIGTIEYIIGEQRYQATRTTPDVAANHKMLREMVLQGCQSAVMEVTSHALDQGRVQHIEFDVGVFTNLTQDHLDYHETMENYAKAKQKLFSSLIPGKKTYPKTAVVNADSPWYKCLIETCPAKIITYAIDNPADIRATNINFKQNGTQFDLVYNGKSYPCYTPLAGRFNVYNALAALSVCLSRSSDLEKLIARLASFKAVSGRLESIENELDISVYVDFAHSDDALINVLQCLQEIKKGRIITVFGCGGDRDHGKRVKMAEACERFSDVCIVTSDNPRSEDPMAIIEQILPGFKNKNSFLVEQDRFKAIEKAIDLAEPQDIVLIAGKGHEPYQIFAHKIIPFDDRKVAREICYKKLQTCTHACSSI